MFTYCVGENPDPKKAKNVYCLLGDEGIDTVCQMAAEDWLDEVGYKTGGFTCPQRLTIFNRNGEVVVTRQISMRVTLTPQVH